MSTGQIREGKNGSQPDRWDRAAKKATVFGTGIAILALVATCGFTVRSVERSADLQIRAARLQANVAAMAILDAHYKFAADQGVPLVASQATNATASEEEPKDELVAQHGLLTANIVFDLTEQTLEHTEMRHTSQFLLIRHRDNIAQLDYPCRALDDEFVKWARNVVKVDPCQGPNRAGIG